MLLWLHEVADIDPVFNTNGEYQRFKLAAIKRFDTPSDKRLPLQLHHLIRYTLSLDCVINRYNTVPLDSLLKVLIIQMYFFTMSRPCELLLSPHSETKRGIKFKHLTFFKPNPSNPSTHFVRIQVVSHKSMKSLNDSKLLYVGHSYCPQTLQTNKSCPCKLLNPLRLLNVYLRRRQKLVAILQKGKRKHALRLSLENSVFVWSSGKVVTSAYLSKIVKEVVAANSQYILEPKRYAAYSARIGGTTRASQVGIAHGLILKYVGWSDSKLPDISMRYIRPTALCLSNMIRNIIHGPPHCNPNTTNRIFLQSHVVFDPWSKMEDRKFCFQKINNRRLKNRK